MTRPTEPTTDEPLVAFRPNAGPQRRFLATAADEALYGGAAGGGKSAALLACPLRWVHNPRFRALYLRRESQYLGDAIDKSSALYPKLGGRLVRSPRVIWTFPSGATIWLNHCEHEKDVRNYDSFEFNVVLFDELTHFTERQFTGLGARLRTTDPTLPTFTRGATNPGGEGHDWVFARWAPWLDPHHPRPAAPGELRWFLGSDEVPRGTPDASSRVFVPAMLSDNPHIAAGYRAKLLALDPVRRAQLLGGDWLAKPAAGAYFKRGWFRIVEAAPARAARCRYWDRAATPDGDWTVGVKTARGDDGVYVIEDVVRFRGRPHEVHATLRQTAALDGPGVTQVLEEDPGQAGKVEGAVLVQLLDGFDVRLERPTGDKVTKASPHSAQVEAGNVALLRAPWNAAFLAEHEEFPEGSYDDQVDAAAGAYGWLAARVPHEAEAPPPMEVDGRWSGLEGRGW